jgi:hypothetical protein
MKKTASGRYPSGYGQLRYVDEAGLTYSNYVERCRLICFRAKFKGGETGRPHIQSFLYAINNPKGRFVDVDPDIRHPGNGGTPPEP